MAAPLGGHGISKQTVNRLFAANLLLCFVLLSIVGIPLNTGGPLDVIANVLPLTLLYCVIIAACQLLFCFSNKDNEKTKLKILNVIGGVTLYGLGCVIFHIIAVLYGAPFTEASAETFHFALLLSTTSVLPACIILGPHLQSWARVFGQNSPELGAESVVQICSVTSVIGAWLGAFPIPLDWDRPWQVWPISCVMGTMLGYCAGLVISAVHLYHRYIILHKIKLT